MATQQELPLAAPVSSGPLSINARCALRSEGEHRVVVVAGLPVHHYSVHDAVAEAYAMVLLVDAGYATQREVAAAFGCSERTLRRHQERYHDGGMAALATRSGWRPGRRRVPTKRLRIIEGLQAEGISNREIARRMGVTEKAIRRQVGPSERCTQQQSLPLDPENPGAPASAMSTATFAAEPLEQAPPSPMGQALPLVSPEQKTPPPASPDQAVSAEPEPVAVSLDSAPANRVWDRLLACFGLLDDAAPVFGNGKAVPGAAVLGAVPVLVASGVFRIAHKVYGEIGPAFYGLRTTLLTLLLMALWRVQRPEALKEHDPQNLGRVLGLDRAPEIKTVRRKLTPRHIAAHRFVVRRAQIDGRTVEYRLHDQAVRFLKGKLRLRQVVRLADDGHQTQVITSRWDLADVEVAYRMFERWRQENFFKYLREEFLLDALADYQVEPDDPTRTVPNPERRALDKDIRNARAAVEQAYGAAAADNSEGRRPTMRSFKIAHSQIGKQLRTARERLTELLTRRRTLPQRVEVGDLSDGAVVKLATERKHLTNLIKMVAYQTESDLLALLRPHYARSDDEGRTLLHELFHAAADIDVTDTELLVTICPLSSPHRTLAVQALCATLTETATVFPGSRLTMRFAIHPRPTIGLAFPGPRPRPAPRAAPSPAT